VSAESHVKALLLTVAQDPAPAIASLQRFSPEMVCFFLPEDSKPIVESAIPTQLPKMPQRWDWIISPDPQSFADCHKVLAQQLPPLLKTWGVSGGELTIDVASATPPMAAAMTLVGFPYASKVVALSEASPEQLADPKVIAIGEKLWRPTQSNPWDDETPRIRQEASDYFNQGVFGVAARVFRLLESRVSGGFKPLYRALADLADGYRLWDQFHYRQAWEKLKAGTKALDLASAWGGPEGIGSFLRTVKENVRFLEQIVLDPQVIKPRVAQDLVAHAKRKADRHRDLEVATRVLLRGLEAFAQSQLFTVHRIKSWDVDPEQLPQALKETCRTCFLNDVDGKFRLPLQAQFRALAGLGDAMGETFLAQWPKIKTLIDAADHAVLGEGFEPIKTERYRQLYEAVLKLTGTNEADLPKFPVMNL
jgi:CRISPR-associated protein (TIGR02710 family)